MKRLLLVLLAAALFTPAATGVTLLKPGGTAWGGTWQRWADESLLPTPAGTVTLVADRCPAYASDDSILGCVYTAQRLVYVRRDTSDRRLTLLHELGHLIEAENATPQERAAWAAANGLTWGTAAREAFANAYAHCARWPAPAWWPPGVCKFVRSIADRAR